MKTQKQTGVVLIFSIILLLVMTVLALSNLNTSTLQERMASNSQDYNKTFLAAESAVSNSINEVFAGSLGVLTEAMALDGVFTGAVSYDILDPQITSTVEVKYNGQVIITGGNSMDSDKNTTQLAGQRFEFKSTSKLGLTETIISQGIDYN
ncbi:MAG: hypothetical protein HRU20_07240 [Pseudomonadales bacterium]|nr:hypothetical protein [Pseudomonadales bacterium]